MHTSSYKIVSDFTDKYVQGGDVVLDIGSCDVNGTFWDLFTHCEYLGLDIEDGPNVDVVVSDPYDWVTIDTESIDIVVCGSVIEHVEFPWLTFEEIYRVLKVGGYFCITAPMIWVEHKHPLDCYRFHVDGMKSLCKWAALTCIEVNQIPAEHDGVGGFVDCYIIGRKDQF